MIRKEEEEEEGKKKKRTLVAKFTKMFCQNIKLAETVAEL